MRRRTIVATSFLVALAAGVPGATLRQESVPRFEPGDCRFSPGAWAETVRLECGSLVVYRDRARPASGTLRLAVAVLHSLTPGDGPPIVLLHGGPSGPGGIRGGEMSVAARLAPAVKRDIIVYDVRGVGLSEPPLCAAVINQGEIARTLPTQAERQALWNAEAKACAADLRSRGFDPASFSTVTNGADLVDLRTTLKITTWDVAGTSYGARLAQEAMRRDAAAIRSVILDSPVLPGPTQEAEIPLSFQRVVDHTFAACAADPVCATAFPTLARDLAEVFTELTAKPLDIRQGATLIRFDGQRMMNALQNKFTVNVARFPLYVHELRHGDRLRAAQLLLGNQTVPPRENTLTNLVGCYESGGAAYHEVLAKVAEQLRPAFRPLLNTLEECPLYQERFAAVPERSFVTSDIPTLIITKEFDDRTQTVNGRRIADHLKKVYLFELPGLAHGQPSPCDLAIKVSFLSDPSKPPDTSCIASLPAMRFETSALEPITLTMEISGAGGAAAPFTGRWEGSFPQAPVPYQFQLKVDGAAVTGVMNAGVQKHPIQQGRIDGRTITLTLASPEADRTVTLTGTLDGEEIRFRRDVVVRPGGKPGGAAILGVGGASAFTVRRVQ